MNGNMIKLMERGLWMAVLLFVTSPALAQQAVASLDRSTVFEGDSVQLRIALNNAAPNIEPDYHAIRWLPTC